MTNIRQHKSTQIRLPGSRRPRLKFGKTSALGLCSALGGLVGRFLCLCLSFLFINYRYRYTHLYAVHTYIVTYSKNLILYLGPKLEALCEFKYRVALQAIEVTYEVLRRMLDPKWYGKLWQPRQTTAKRSWIFETTSLTGRRKFSMVARSLCRCQLSCACVPAWEAGTNLSRPCRQSASNFSSSMSLK